MPGGSVASCRSHSTKAKASGERIIFFTFPKDPELSKQWLQECYRKDKVNTDMARICSKHFVNEDFEDALKAELLHTTPKKLKATGQ